MPGQRIERTGLLTSRNAPMLNKRMPLEEDEYIADVVGSVGFATTAFACNPGQSTVFPWGSRIAQLYEEYDFEYLEFYVTSEVSGYATQGQTGVVILSFDYDASDAAPTTKQQVEAMNPHTVPCLPSTSVIALTVDCKNARLADGKFVRPGALPANTDIKTYDIGNLFVSTQGQANTTAFGELHVRYKCNLRQQVLEAATVAGGVLHFSGVAPTTADNFAGAVQMAGGSPSLTGITAAANVITFPAGIPGNYLVQFNVGGSTSGSLVDVVASAGASALNLLTSSTGKDTASEQPSLASGATTVSSMTATITVATTGGLLTLNTPATLVGGNRMDLFIVSLPSTVLTMVEEEQHEILKLQASNNALQDRLGRLEQMMLGGLAMPKPAHRPVDSDFDDQDEEKSPGRPRIKEHPLSASTVDLIGELIARKSSSHK
jgi:hypothetical protein